MAADNRDWYRDLLRKKTKYVERSTFRRPALDADVERVFGLPKSSDVKRPIKRTPESSFWRVGGAALVGLLLFALVIKLLIKLFVSY